MIVSFQCDWQKIFWKVCSLFNHWSCVRHHPSKGYMDKLNPSSLVYGLIPFLSTSVDRWWLLTTVSAPPPSSAHLFYSQIQWVLSDSHNLLDRCYANVMFPGDITWKQYFSRAQIICCAWGLELVQTLMLCKRVTFWEYYIKAIGL